MFGAENGTRTRDPNLGKVVLYQLSYFRLFPRCKVHFSKCGCKGNDIFGTDKLLRPFFSKKLHFSTSPAKEAQSMRIL